MTPLGQTFAGPLLSAALLQAGPPPGAAELPVLAEPPAAAAAAAAPVAPAPAVVEVVCECPRCRAARAVPAGPAAGPRAGRFNAVPDGDRYPNSEVGPPYHYDRAFDPPELGRLMHQAMGRQVANGEAALAVVRRTDFHPGTARLTANGVRRLARTAARLPACADPVRLQPAADPALSEARRAEVARLLAGGPFPVPPQRVVVVPDGGPDIGGLQGTDAELVYRNLLILTGSGGKLRTRFDVFGQGPPRATGPSAGGPAETAVAQ